MVSKCIENIQNIKHSNPLEKMPELFKYMGLKYDEDFTLSATF